MGTADKVCVAALAIAEQAERFARPLDEVSLVLLELGGAFTAVIAGAGGKIVDGAGGAARAPRVPAAGGPGRGGSPPPGAPPQGGPVTGRGPPPARWGA